MKPLLENIEKHIGQYSFAAFAINKASFEFFWHYHPAYELTLIVKGKGRRIIGDHHEFYETGDLVLIGPDLPHTWVSDNNTKGESSAIVVQFSKEFIDPFIGLQELTAINKLLHKAKQGVAIKDKNAAAIKEHLKALPNKNGLERITSLLQILGELTALNQVTLSSPFYQPLKGTENEKIKNKICQYIQKHATDPLSIQKAAALIHLSPSAFCKFFKRATGKTFSDYVNDIRIANVCSQLMASDKPIAEIAYTNGFETLTYFNRIFYKKKNIQPSRYRKISLA
jgi:AraC-like DNA-binding protein